ncbi:MAG: NlpC/P60 family protein [Verrucomicrobiota bacterium]
MAQLTPEQHKQLVDTARWISRYRIRYSQDWTPPGENREWTMDCSNTARYLYKKVLGTDIPRTASDQYYELSRKHKITPAPLMEDGSVDTEKLLGMLRSGDLLFWEWTYNIKRRPPISHVMIYLGKTKNGTPKMVGSSSASWGEKTRSGGVDVYVFDPNASMGGVKNFWGHYVRRGRFVGFGRIIEVDRTEQAEKKILKPLPPPTA